MMNAVTEKGTQDDVWYVDSGASNHMTSHDEWFGEMQGFAESRLCADR